MSFQPERIKKEHVFKAFEDIDNQLVTIKPSTKFDVIYQGNKYPPKEIMRLAHKHATGKYLWNLSGGEPTNKYLSKLGLQIAVKSKNIQLYLLKDEFLTAWPIERLNTMVLEEYTNLDKESSFCYWLETRTTDLGSIWGGSAYKFGIFKRKDLSTDSYNKKRRSDGDYSWYGKYGDTKEEAFQTVKKMIIHIANAANNDDLKAIDAVDLGNTIKWKIAFLYGDYNCFNVFKLDALRDISSSFNIDYTAKTSISHLHQAILKSKPVNKDYYDWSQQLWRQYESPLIDVKNDFAKWLNTRTFDSYRAYLGTTDQEIIDKLDEINAFFDDVDFFLVDPKKVNGLISTILFVLSKKERNKNPDFVEYDSKNSNGIPKAILGKNNYIKFLKEKFTTEEENNPIPSFINDETVIEKPTMLPINQILYGPPGTGKTFYLKSELFDKYTIKGTSISKEKHFEEVVSNLTWWQAIALALLESGVVNVTTILANRWVAKKASLSESKNVRATIWGTLQMHTIEESETVAYKQRQIPLIFDKTEHKEWELLKTELDEQSPELYDILNSVNNFEANPNKSIENFDFVTFHQSFAYEDFIEGIKPILPEEGDETKDLGYTIENGVFKNLCLKAQNDPENKYAIFIDEINRGNVSAIFGELITLIELDKRKGAKNELSIKLPYSKKDFSVPINLDIYGTMNTADRSVEALDTALRRRFVFKEVMPKADLLSNITFHGFNLQEVLEVINNRIEALLDRDHTIGHSYFIQLQNNNTDGLLKVFKNNIVPLLQEYFYNDYEKIALVLGSGFVKEKKLKKDIFLKFTELPNMEEPDLSNAYELITDLIDIEHAVLTLLGKPNA